MAFTALAAGVSGLQAFTEGVGVIADNITNVNTIGYKETRSRFSTLVTETSSRSSYSPGGVRAFAESLVSKQGLLLPSSSTTDMAIDGSGFFAVRNGDSAQDNAGELVYTRAGAFTEDDQGFYKNTAGLYLMGWRLDSAGNPPANLQSPSILEPINITQLNGISEATSQVAMRANLKASTPIYAGTPAYVATGGQLAAGTIEPHFQTNIQIFDSLGREHTVLVSALKTGANTWAYEYNMSDSAGVLDATAHPNGLIAQGSMSFNTDGSIDLGSTTLFDVNAAARAAVTLPAGNLSFTYDSSATATSLVTAGSINLDFGTDGLGDGWTQSESDSSLISKSVDGAKFDNVNGILIDESGVVSATFENGLSKRIYQIPVAVFDNPNGLQRKQGNAYGVSDLSGEVTYQKAGNSGAGKVATNALEGSTVDLASEFAELIKVQRAFSASTRIITTSDEILQELTRI